MAVLLLWADKQSAFRYRWELATAQSLSDHGPAANHTHSEAVPQTDVSYRSVAATRSPTNLRSVPVAKNLTHL
jgi:hypothetical protein